MKIYIGIDVGTTSVKAVALNRQGKTLALAKSDYELRADGAKVTQSAEDWWTATCKAVRRMVTAIRESHDPEVAEGHICAIGMSAQGGTLTALDADGKPILEAMTWMDKRATAECEELRAHFGNRTFYERFGWQLQPSSDVSKLLWLKKHDPELYASAATFPSTPGYVNLCLTGKLVEDPTCASIRRLYDFRAEAMAADVLDYLGLTEEQVPVTLPTAAPVGRLTPAAAEALGLDTDVMVYNGAHDQYCASLGSGTARPGELLLATGTAWVLFAVTESPLFSPSLISPCTHPAGGYGALCTVSGIGATFEWLSDLTATPLPELSRGAEARVGKDDGFFFRPSASGTGLLIGSSTGAHMTGLTIGHDKYDLALALMEGAAFETALVIREFCKNGLENLRSITMTGGATASRLWQSIIANVTGLDVYASTETNSPAVGAAMIAAAEGEVSALATLSGELCSPRERISPDGNAAYYQEKFKAYLAWRATHEST